MTAYAPTARHVLLSRCRGALLALAIGLAAPMAHAANPGDWWVYVANDYPDDIKDLLAHGSDPNVRYKNGQPALMRAVVDGAWKVFDVIAADKRTDVNAENPAGETPLMYLAIAGQTERAKKLIARGAQVNRLGWTPLHYAASKGQMEMARMLLSKKAMVNAPAPGGETPLMMAALGGNKDMVDLLVKAGADV
ncbi:MAG: ankyrin repeat domain-containing protein, partial [Achromobacter kerstersii]